ncbi:MAG: hypothetical protein WKG00_00325 [Polyangiaceae bacterium]
MQGGVGALVFVWVGSPSLPVPGALQRPSAGPPARNVQLATAHAGICFDLLLAIGAHLSTGDGKFAPALACLVLLAISYALDRKLHPRTVVATS